MNSATATFHTGKKLAASPISSLRFPRSSLLQRKCACGGTPGLTGECEECSRRQRFGLQAKLKINEPRDIYEQEADRVADQVMSMPTDSAASDISSAVARGTSDGGHALDTSTRAFMQSRFVRDFGDVRIHTGPAAEASARALGAAAYTVGHDIVFGAGRYAPHTSEGRWLLSHELTHTIQQGGPSRGMIQMVGECAGKSMGNCSGACVHANGNAGTCRWSGTVKYGCVCYENPRLSPAKQVLYELILAALIAAGIVLTVAVVAAVVACLMGPCEAAALIAAVGFAAAMIILGIVRSGGGASSGPTVAGAEGETAGAEETA